MPTLVKSAKKKQKMKPIKQKGFQVTARIDESNENHHIYLNKEIWWMSLSVRFPSSYTKRMRFSLMTKNVEKARKLRDAVLASFC